MGKIYSRFKELKRRAAEGFTDKTGLVKLEENGEKYEIYFTKKRANKYSIIHCKDYTIEWEQFPVLPRIAGRICGKQEPIVHIAPTKECIRIFVIMGKPNSITGLDEGVFRSVHKYDARFINVMSEDRFKAL